MTTPGTSAGTLKVRVVTDATGLARDVERTVQGAADQATRGTDRASRTIGDRVNRLGTQASIGLTLPMLALGKHALGVASDTVEATNKVKVVFGESAATVEAFAATAAKTIGVSRREALAGASAFGALFTTMGLAPEVAGKMSTSMVTLGADMASFSNSSPEEALQALRSGLNGESEPLRRFGVFLSDARMQAEALAAGLVKPVANAAKVKDAAVGLELATRRAAEAVKKHGADSDEAMQAQRGLTAAENAYAEAAKGTVPALTEAQKAQARYNIIQKDTKQAQGDVARSAKTSAAVQASFAKAARDDAAGALGQSLIPLSITASQMITKLANAFSALSPEQQKMVLGTVAGLAVLGPSIKAYQATATVVGGVSKALRSETAARAASRAGTIAGTIAGKLYVVVLHAQRLAMIAANVAGRVLAIGMRLVGIAVRFALGPVGLVIIGLTLLAAGLLYAWRNSETFRNVVMGALAGVAAGFRGFLAGVQAVFGWIKGHWKLLLAIITGPIGMAVYLVTQHFGKIKSTVAAVFGTIKNTISAAGRVITGVASSIGSAFSRAFGLVTDGVRGVVGAVKNAVNGIIRALKAVKIPGFSAGWGPAKVSIPGFAPFDGIPYLADGGVVPRTPGGRIVGVAEGRHDELVAPLDGKLAQRLGLEGRSGDVHLTIVVQNPEREPASESVNKRLRRLAALGIADQAGAGARQLATVGA